MFAASALAANTVCRSACGAAAPLFTQYMFDALGVGGGGSLIGGVATLLAPIPFVFYKYGGPIRERSKFAPSPTTKADKKEEEGDGQREQGLESAESTVLEESDSGSSIHPVRSIDREADRDDVTKKEEEEIETGRKRGDDFERDVEKGE